MNGEIPYDRWLPLSVAEVVKLLDNAPFQWCLAGGYAVEQFLGAAIRPHDDIDILIFRDEQLSFQRWLADWQWYAADPPGTLRQWHANEYLAYGIHDIWGHQAGSQAWQLQMMLAEVEGADWFSRRHRSIRGKREDLIALYNGLPCVRIEVQLMYKAKGLRPKDDLDFHACLPSMSQAAKHWLREQLLLLHPEGHAWLAFLP